MTDFVFSGLSRLEGAPFELSQNFLFGVKGGTQGNIVYENCKARSKTKARRERFP